MQQWENRCREFFAVVGIAFVEQDRDTDAIVAVNQ
jgi:hypothetical protein